MNSKGQKGHFSTETFFSKVFICLDFLGLGLKTWDILNLRKIKCTCRVCTAIFVLLGLNMCAWLPSFLCSRRVQFLCLWVHSWECWPYSTVPGPERGAYQNSCPLFYWSLQPRSSRSLVPRVTPSPLCSISPPPITEHGHFFWLLVIISNNLNEIWQTLLPEWYWSHPEEDVVWNLVLFFLCLSLNHLPSNQGTFINSDLATGTLNH